MSSYEKINKRLVLPLLMTTTGSERARDWESRFHRLRAKSV